ncbi:MAG TPA: hypothetical protein VL128_13185 [Candidatus Eisenbacteria bacterium]|nr:hypothetical protein [Candidatus Eisenbacteria bacterium]
MLENEPLPDQSRTSVITIAIGIVVLAAIGVSLWVVLKPAPVQRPPAVQINIPAPMNVDETSYAKNVRFENVAMSRAENFLHQEVTILRAEAVNGGTRPLQRIVVTVEFSNDAHEVIFRESRAVLGNPPAVLSPGQRRSFEISFDGVPPSWNMQRPAVEVTYLEFAPQE